MSRTLPLAEAQERYGALSDEGRIGVYMAFALTPGGFRLLADQLFSRLVASGHWIDATGECHRFDGEPGRTPDQMAAHLVHISFVERDKPLQKRIDKQIKAVLDSTSRGEAVVQALYACGGGLTEEGDVVKPDPMLLPG